MDAINEENARNTDPDGCGIERHLYGIKYVYRACDRGSEGSREKNEELVANRTGLLSEDQRSI